MQVSSDSRKMMFILFEKWPYLIMNLRLLLGLTFKVPNDRLKIYGSLIHKLHFFTIGLWLEYKHHLNPEIGSQFYLENGPTYKWILKTYIGLDLQGSEWSSSPLCSSIHGGFRGNALTLHRLMTNHLSDSFRLLSMVFFLLSTTHNGWECQA